jgi:hypothetical protein
VNLKPIATMLRFIPNAVTGLLLNIVIALTIHRITAVWLLGDCSFKIQVIYVCSPLPLGIGTFGTALASVFFAVIVPGAPYWAFGFPGAIFSVFGADFVFASGTLYVAKIVKPHEQSLAGAMFTTMTQVNVIVVYSSDLFPDEATIAAWERNWRDRDHHYI